MGTPTRSEERTTLASHLTAARCQRTTLASHTALVALISLLLFHISATVASAADPLADALRIPVMNIPQSNTPSVDGRITKGEWVHYARPHDLVVSVGADEDLGFAAAEQTHVYVSYNENALHIGFKMNMEPGIAPKVAATQGHDTGFSDDAFEFMLIPNDGQGPIYHFGGNSAGVSWDRLVEGNHPDLTWNPATKYAVQVDTGNNWWVGEWVVPWSSLGVPAPKEGDIWRANFVSNRRSPQFRLDTWSYWKKWWDHPNNGRIIFGGTSCATMVGRQSAEAFNGNGLFLAVNAPSTRTVAQPAQVDYDYKLLRRDTPGQSFNLALQMRRDKATGEAATFASFDDDVQAVLAEYAAAEGLRKTQPVPPEGWTGPWGGSIKVDKPGDYVLMYTMRDVTDAAAPKLISSAALPFRVRMGISADVWPHLLTRGSVIIEGDLRAVPKLEAVTTLRGRITSVGGEKVFAEVAVPRKEPRKQVVEVPAKDVPAGAEYEARLAAIAGDGSVVSEVVTTFKRPEDPDWWTNRHVYGSEPEVPKPWTPIEWSGNTARVWGRQIVFAPTALPATIVTRDADVLAAPIDLELRANGAVVPWSGTKLDVKEQRPGHVILESVREAGGVRVTTRTQFEFDGFALVELAIESTGNAATVDGLDLVIPVRTQHALFLTNYRNAPGPGPAVTRFVGKTPEHYESPVMLTTWLGTDDYGLEWSCESSRDWFISKPKSAIEVNRKGDVTEARFHLIDTTMTIDRKRVIRFGLIPTPTKPVDPAWRNWRIDGLSYCPPEAGVDTIKGGAVASEEDVKNWHRQYGMIDVSAMLLPGDWSGTMCWHPHVTDPQVAETMRHRIAQLNQFNMKGLWNGGWAIAPYAPQWDPWGKEMIARPIAPTFANERDGTYTSPYVEFMVGSWSLNIRDLGLHGVRFDTVVPWNLSANPYLGETWNNEANPDDKTVYGTQALWRQRELLKRMYREFVRQGQPGIFWMGIAGPPIMSAESFVTIREVAEGFYMNSPSLKDAYPQDAVRPWMTHRAYGFVEVNSIKGKPLRSISRLGPLLVADASPRITGRDYMNQSTYEPSNHDAVPAHRLWDAWSWIDRGTSTFHPHWNNKDVITTSTPGGEHYASLHLQKGRRVLLVVANYEKTPMEVTVELNRAALGFAPGVVLEAQDAVTRQPAPMQGDAIVLSILPENFRLVKIGTHEELIGKNLDPAHPEPLP